jgi:hypothetical protein
MPDHSPVRQSCVVSLLFSPPAVHCDDTGTRIQDCLRVLKRLLFRLENPHLRRDRDFQLFMAFPYHPRNQSRIFLQECTVLPPLRYALRTPEVQVYRIAEGRNMFCGSQEVIRIVRAELHGKRSVEHWISIQMPIRIFHL